MRAHWTTSLRALALAAGVACGSNGTSRGQPDGGGAPVVNDDGSASWTPGGNTNPDGFAYPSPANGYGRTARSGSTPGSIMKNFVFLGYLDAIVLPQPTRIALSNFYDPCSKRYRLIHLSVASVWCIPCQQETDAMVAAKHQLDSQGVVVVQALADGPVRLTGATQGDLDGWINNHHSSFTELLDPGLQNLAGFFDAAAVPWNSDLDPRTMEIIDASTGWTGDITTELAPAFSALPTTPSFAPSVKCN